MALNATPADPAANSYLTVDEATSLAASIGMTAWTGKTGAQQEAALLLATQELEGMRFHNARKSVETQALVFPRECDGGTIPDAVKWAQLFEAEWLLSSGLSDRRQWDSKQEQKGAPGLCPRARLRLAKFINAGLGSYGHPH